MEKDMTKVVRVIVAIALVLGILALLGAWDQAGAVEKYDIDRHSGQLAFAKDSGCADAHLRVRGGNVLFPSVVVGHATVHWCWRDGKVRDNGTFDADRWGDASWGWAYEGVSSTVTGGCLGCSHLYRRYHFHFSRAIQGFGEHVYPWVAITMRGNGSCAMDRTDLDGSVECGQVAGGGGGGGSW